MYHFVRFLFSTSLLLMPISVAAEQMDGMDWKGGEISASGIGVPPEHTISKAQAHALACRAAKVDALRNLLERTKGVQVDSVTLVRDAMVDSDLIRTAVSGLVKGAYEKGRRLMPDGACEVTLAMAMAGQLFSALISEEEYYKRIGKSRHSALGFSERMQLLTSYLAEQGLVVEANAGVVPVIRLEDESQLSLAKKLMQTFAGQNDLVAAGLLERAISDYELLSGFSGIVIDASSVPGFQAAMLPLIRDHTGKKLYPNEETPYEVVRTKMPVSYDVDINDAINSDRVADKPLLIRAISIFKSKKSDLMLSEADETRFIEVMQKRNVNDKAKILIVLAD
ncbi:MAG: hypothetical protein R8M38_03325 [Mariprofundaceae bacterium]